MLVGAWVNYISFKASLTSCLLLNSEALKDGCLWCHYLVEDIQQHRFLYSTSLETTIRNYKFLIQCPPSWLSHFLTWLLLVGVEALTFYSKSQWKCTEVEMDMGLMAYPWCQWLGMKKQMTRLSTPLIRICILSGNVFLKDIVYALL